MRVTINDIAHLAQVSPSTVSRVIAGNTRISEATRERVLKIMKEHHYHPNIIARSLANRSTKIIGVIIPGSAEKAFLHPFFPEVLRGISSTAYQKGYNILISCITNSEEEKQAVKQFAREGIAAGIILLASRVNDPSVAELQGINFPLVVLGRPEDENRVNWVDNDNIAAGYELTEHFIKLGHRNIAFVGVSPDFLVTVDRLRGYKKALEAHNLPYCEELIIESCFIENNGFDLIRQAWREGIRPSAIIACDDLIAFGIIKYLAQEGLKVPGDVAVAGFNNVPLADYFNPTLTSVEIDAYSLGVKAFELLYLAIHSEHPSFNRAIIPTRLIVRNSSGE